jgi:hypothetical protein
MARKPIPKIRAALTSKAAALTRKTTKAKPAASSRRPAAAILASSRTKRRRVPPIKLVDSKGRSVATPASLPPKFSEPLQPGQLVVDMSKPKAIYYMVADIGLSWDGKGWNLSGTTLAVLTDTEVGQLAQTRRRVLRANGWM